jgi:hypothetical protein
MNALTARILLALLAVQALIPGVWATVSPRSFYDDFPTSGRAWVAADGPYNEHLMRDFGALNLALAVVTIAALVWLTRPLVITAALAWLAWSVPHTVYHFRHRDVFEDSDRFGAVGGLAMLGVLAILLLVLPVRASKASLAEDEAVR